MRVIYLDVLLAMNFCMDYCILRASAAISGKNCPIWRLILSAAFGAIYAGCCVLFPVFTSLPMKLAVCGIMAGTAFAVRSMNQLLRKSLLVLLVSFVFGGCVFALEQLFGRTFSANGIFYAPVSWKVLLAAAALAYGISGIVFRNQAKEKRPYGETVCVTCYGMVQEVYVLVDSGNILRDPMTGRPVLILTRTAAMRILPEKLQFLPLLLGEDNAAQLVGQTQQAGMTGWRLISFQTIGGGGMMPCFHPDTVIREDGSIYDSVIAISGTDRLCSGEYEGLIEP